MAARGDDGGGVMRAPNYDRKRNKNKQQLRTAQTNSKSVYYVDGTHTIRAGAELNNFFEFSHEIFSRIYITFALRIFLFLSLSFSCSMATRALILGTRVCSHNNINTMY